MQAGPVLGAALVALLLWAGSARADRWVRDDEGLCRREWTPASLARGPIAMANGLILPFRSLAGGLTGGVPAALASPVGMVLGLAEGVSWIAVGTLEIASGGAVGFAPEGAADRLHFGRVVQLPLGRRNLEAYRTELCEEDPAAS
jgi:hypothetical protein